MKTFPSNFTTEKNKKTGASPVWILKCPFPSTGTIYLSDRIFTVTGWDGGITTKSWVSSWGQIDEDISENMSLTKVSDFNLDLIIDPDASPSIDTILWTDANNIETTDCILYLWFLGLDASTDPPQEMWRGNIIDFEKIDELKYSVQMMDISIRLDKYIGTKTDLATYPNMHLDDVGKVENILYGSPSHVRALRTDWGARSSLINDITESQTSIEVTDASRFPSSGSIWIDEEKISYTGKSSNTFTGCSRAQGGTTATIHNAWSDVWEHKSQYDSLLAEHQCKSVPAIYAVIQDLICRIISGVSIVYTGGKHYIRATEQLSIKSAENIDVINQVHRHQISDTVITDTLYLNYVNVWADGMSIGAEGPPANMIDNNFSTHCDFDSFEEDSSAWVEVRRTASYTLPPYNKITQIRLCILAKRESAVFHISCNWKGANFSNSDFPDDTKITVKKAVNIDEGNLSEIYDMIHISLWAGESWGEIEIFEVWLEIDRVQGSNDGGYTIAKGGGIISTRYVDYFLADAEGYQDDGSGTFTGTPNALIERPDHVKKHFLYTYISWAVANFYTDAGSQFSTKGYKFAVCINEYKKLKEWLALMAFQCRCYFRFAGGKANLLYRPDSITSDKTITAAMIRMQEDGRTTLRGPRRSPLDEVINKINLHYDKDWSKSGDEAYRKISKATDSTSITHYGEKEKPELFYFDFVTIQAMADDLRDFCISRYKNRKKISSMEIFLDNSELEFADGTSMEFPSDYLISEAGNRLISEDGDYLITDNNLLSEIQKVNIYPGSGKEMRNDIINLVMREG